MHCICIANMHMHNAMIAFTHTCIALARMHAHMHGTCMNVAHAYTRALHLHENLHMHTLHGHLYMHTLHGDLHMHTLHGHLHMHTLHGHLHMHKPQREERPQVRHVCKFKSLVHKQPCGDQLHSQTHTGLGKGNSVGR